MTFKHKSKDKQTAGNFPDFSFDGSKLGYVSQFRYLLAVPARKAGRKAAASQRGSQGRGEPRHVALPRAVCHDTQRRLGHTDAGTYLPRLILGWLRGTVGRTSVFDRRTFPVLRSTCS